MEDCLKHAIVDYSRMFSVPTIKMRPLYLELNTDEIKSMDPNLEAKLN